MDFRNEAFNMLRMKALLDASAFNTDSLVIPLPKLELTTRRCVCARVKFEAAAPAKSGLLNG